MSAHRIEARRRRQKRPGVTLNLVSLMDIFTILVFFLMVNSSGVEMLEPTPGLKLPDSSANLQPDPFVVVSIHGQRVAVGDRDITTVDAILGAPQDVVPELRDALTTARIDQAGESVQDGLMRPVTIMGDRELPYTVLKRVMASCQAASLNEVELAINQTGRSEVAI